MISTALMISGQNFHILQNTLRQDIQGTKGDLNDTNRNINGTKDQLSQIESGAQNSIRMVSRFSLL